MDPARDPRPGARTHLNERVRRLLKFPRTLRPTRAGWGFFALTLGTGFAALNTGNNLLYLVLSLMLAFLVLSGVLSEAALRGIEVARHLPQEVFAGTANRVVLEVRNAQRRVASFAIVVEDRLAATRSSGGNLGAAGRVFVLRVGAMESETRSYALHPEARGRLRFEGLRVSTRFPFGLFLKAKTLESPAEILVYPAIHATHAMTAWGGEDQDGAEAAEATGNGSDVTGLRDFTAGDPLRRVHWRASLRRSALVVREVEDERVREVEVRLATSQVGQGERFEARVRSAASEAVAQLEAGLHVALRTDATRLDAGAGIRQRTRLLSFLAQVEPEVAARSPEANAR